MNKPIVTGLMAYGMSGKIFHAPFLDLNENFILKSIVERSKNEIPKDYPNVQQLRNIDDLLADDEIELIVVNTPNFTHFEYAKKALNAGKHVLIEKPVTATVKEAEELFKLAEAKNLKVLSYQNRRFDGDYFAVKKAIESKKLGNIFEVNIRFDRYRPEIGPKFFKEENYPANGILYDLGAHIIDQAISLFGIPESFNKTYGYNRANSKVDDFAHVHLKYKNGLNVFITTNMLVVEPLPAYVIHGDLGTFTKTFSNIQEEQLGKGIKPNDAIFGQEEPNTEGKLTYINASGEKIMELAQIEKGDYMLLFNAVYNTIRNQKPYFVTKEELLAQLHILEK